MRRIIACLALLVPLAAHAQEGGALALTLDSLQDAEGACRLTFVARNGLGADIDPLVLEAVAFDAEGGVARIALFDFGALPAGRPRVRQFDLPDLACGAIGSLLVNGVERCEGGPEDCAARLGLASRAGVELIG